jgi:hypothetical protein
VAEFYKMNPAKWDFGTAGLTLEQEAAYLRIVNAINKHDAPVPDNDRVLAGMFRCSTRKARALLNGLIDAGKVRIEEGVIINDHAISDVVQRQLVRVSRAEAGANGGRTTSERRSKALENNDQQFGLLPAEKRREEKSTEPNGSDGEAVDFTKAIFERGVAFLRRHGLKEDRARSVIGKWRKNHGERAVFDALAAASKAGVTNPLPWIEARLRKSEADAPPDGLALVGGSYVPEVE